MSTIEKRIAELGYKLPESKAIGSYVPAKRTKSDFIFTSGQIPSNTKGKVSEDWDGVSIGAAQEAAKECVLKALSAIKQVADLDQISIVKVTGYINSDTKFRQQHLVMNGASDLLVEIFGKERGLHARAAVGVSELPTGAAVEIEMIVEVVGREFGE